MFGYSIDLSNDKLIVGCPFNGFDPTKVWDWTEVSGAPYLSGYKISEYGGAGGAFFFERTGKGENATSQFLPFEYKDKIKPESANVGVSGGLSAANIKVKKILEQKGVRIMTTKTLDKQTNLDALLLLLLTCLPLVRQTTTG